MPPKALLALFRFLLPFCLSLSPKNKKLSSVNVECRCSVCGFAWATTNRTIAEPFAQISEILKSKIFNERDTGRSRGFGCLTFNDEQSMRDVIGRTNGQSLDRKSIVWTRWWWWWFEWGTPWGWLRLQRRETQRYTLVPSVVAVTPESGYNSSNYGDGGLHY